MAANPETSQYHEVTPERLIHYTDHAPIGASNGTAIFIHGSGPGASGWSNFKHNVSAFQEAGYRCIIFDQWGYGKTSKPQDVDHTLDFFVDGLVSLMDSADVTNAVLVGNSLGGAVALGLALRHPERVEKLILMAPGGIESREDYFSMPGIQAMVKYPMGSPEFTKEVLAQLLTQLVYDPVNVDDELVDERWATLETQNAHVLATMQIPDLSDQLASIDINTLVFWGTEDRFCPASGTWKILQMKGNVQAELVNYCGHWVMSEYPELFNERCLSFLSK
ncbi:putative hydrolase or acyltransferase of alpha/beta superfamily [gamma proteobacterium HIMB55]|nr:putative hydrolase or acyltransferase of alpha/beta superfamily [gamma proteobacterium HIMB55]